MYVLHVSSIYLLHTVELFTLFHSSRQPCFSPCALPVMHSRVLMNYIHNILVQPEICKCLDIIHATIYSINTSMPFLFINFRNPGFDAWIVLSKTDENRNHLAKECGKMCLL